MWLVLVSSPPLPRLPSHSSNMVQSALGPKRIRFEMQTQDVDDMARSLPLAPHRFISAQETGSFDEDVLFISFFFYRRRARMGMTISTPSRLTPPCPTLPQRGAISRASPESKKRHTPFPTSPRPRKDRHISYLSTPGSSYPFTHHHTLPPITASSHTPSSARSS